VYAVDLSETHTFIRTVEGVLAMCLSFKKKPLIRYSRSSELAKLLAVEVTVWGCVCVCVYMYVCVCVCAFICFAIVMVLEITPLGAD